MILAEYDAEDTMRGFYEYGREEGYEEGRREGRLEGEQEGWQRGKEAGRQEGWQQGKDAGRQEGRLEGRQEGREEGQNGAWKAVVLEMLKHGQSKEAIAEMTGIPMEAIISYQ